MYMFMDVNKSRTPLHALCSSIKLISHLFFFILSARFGSRAGTFGLVVEFFLFKFMYPFALMERSSKDLIYLMW